jgi:hypothetical protein
MLTRRVRRWLPGVGERHLGVRRFAPVDLRRQARSTGTCSADPTKPRPQAAAACTSGDSSTRAATIAATANRPPMEASASRAAVRTSHSGSPWERTDRPLERSSAARAPAVSAATARTRALESFRRSRSSAVRSEVFVVDLASASAMSRRVFSRPSPARVHKHDRLSGVPAAAISMIASRAAG